MPTLVAKVARRVLVAACCLSPAIAVAGPPYVTDDPEPVEYHHLEVYLATQGGYIASTTSPSRHRTSR